MAKKKDLLNSPVTWTQLIFIFVLLFGIFVAVYMVQQQTYRRSDAAICTNPSDPFCGNKRPSAKG